MRAETIWLRGALVLTGLVNGYALGVLSGSTAFASCSQYSCDEVDSVYHRAVDGSTYYILYSASNAWTLLSPGPLAGNKTTSATEQVKHWIDCDLIRKKCGGNLVVGEAYEGNKSAWDGAGNPPVATYGSCVGGGNVSRQYCADPNSTSQPPDGQPGSWY